MRKVLLATTALVAMGGVSAASADITLGGSASYNYITNSGSGTGPTAAESRDMSTTTDANIAMSAALDNGMTIDGLVSLDEGGVDDSGWSISGDFGKLAFGGTANDGFGTTATGLTADEAITLSAVAGAAAPYKTVHNDFVPHSNVSLTLPTVSGFTLGLGMTDGTTNASDGTQWGVTYAMAAGSMDITAAYASASAGSGSANDVSSVGVKVVSGDMTIVVARNEIDTYEASSVGASYKVSDALTVQAYAGTTEKSDTAAYEVKDTGIGLTYTVTTGLTISVTNNDFTGKGGTAGAEDGSRTVIALDATF
ncbi:MAG: porin [Alphaproteobacteria bacterium]|nr:porin [Alphaproteobacteria bacterium]